MKILTAEELLQEALKYHEGAEDYPRNLAKAEHLYNKLLNRNTENPILIMCLGLLYIDETVQAYGLASILFKRVTEMIPENDEAWSNLGVAYKRMNMTEEARAAFEKALELNPSCSAISSNLSGLYINSGEPEKCIKYCDDALALDPNHTQSLWHKGLALLEMQQFEEGWAYHEARLLQFTGNIAERNYHGEGKMTPLWDGYSPGLVVIHGEQGLGDEVLFSSCIPDAIATGADIIFECAPRMLRLFQRAFPEIRVVGTHATDGSEWPKGYPDPSEVDYKCAIGSLPSFYRPSVESFPGTEFLVPNKKLAQRFRNRLDKLGPKPKIGVAWQGGVTNTRMDLRSVDIEALKPLFELDADFISLQYTKGAQYEVDKLQKETGVTVHHWKEAAQASDLDILAAMISELDMVVSVCQTCIHIAGALGIPTLVLTPSRPAWRYGVVGNMPWYNSVNLVRQEGDDWSGAIEVAASIAEKCCNKEGALV